MGKYCPKMQRSMAIDALSIFGKNTKIAQTGECSRSWESVTKRLPKAFKSVLFTETYLFPVKSTF